LNGGCEYRVTLLLGLKLEVLFCSLYKLNVVYYKFVVKRMIKKSILLIAGSILAFGLLGCSDESGKMSMDYSKEGMGRSGIELESVKSRMKAMRESKNNTLPPPREDGQHDINFPSWIGGYEKQDE